MSKGSLHCAFLPLQRRSARLGPGSSIAFLRWAASAGLWLGQAVPALSAVPADLAGQPARMAAPTLASPPHALPGQPAATGGASEVGLRLSLALQSAIWPGDLVRLADEYLQQLAHPTLGRRCGRYPPPRGRHCLVLRFTNELTNEIDGFVRQARRKPQP